MFKRPRLSAQTFPVNAGIAGFLLFYAVSCSGPQEPEENPVDAGEIADEAPPEGAATAEDSLPAVWSTNNLDHAVSGIGISGGAGSTFAVAYADGGVQIFNFDAERVTGIAESSAIALGEGRYALLSGTPVTFFPGIDPAGDLKVWIHGGQLSEAIEYDLKGTQQAPAVGLCAAPPLSGSSALHRLAYWSDASDTLHIGEIVEESGELSWNRLEDMTADSPVTACTFTTDGVRAFSAPVTQAATLRRLGRETLLTLSDTGTLTAIYDNGESQDLVITDGITVEAPPLPTALAAAGDARGGGYPGGVIVLGGSVATGDNRAVMVDPSRITLTPISVPPGQQ